MYQSPVITPAMDSSGIQPYGFLWSTDVLVWEYGVGVASGIGIIVAIYVV